MVQKNDTSYFSRPDLANEDGRQKVLSQHMSGFNPGPSDRCVTLRHFRFLFKKIFVSTWTSNFRVKTAVIFLLSHLKRLRMSFHKPFDAVVDFKVCKFERIKPYFHETQ
ncbi:hypothetical protein LOTGIDRAFT_168798 [Lottia gigantea]|uniref:Uncharacterized protein n=1 Tax=Lottia gigantea TaxID=225164 RepID=V3Z1F8_LOTGI|nr:hypothetical protein LOTGIDRAFT_168798 [Lottia gigantea]ESO84353.1 hypothetical protein LOTGIDRAFT_168798 [Lottia gigantea]